MTGEESAVVHYLNSEVAKPTFIPPRPFERGYRGRPTLIQNPETLAQLALVARFGSRWYRELGTVADPGSALVTITGRGPSPRRVRAGLRDADERPAGRRRRAVRAASGAARRRVLRHLDGRLCRRGGCGSPARTCARSGCSLGSGVLIALGESACGLHESARVIAYLADQSAGQCGPCLYGLRAIADAVGALAERGRASARARARPALGVRDPRARRLSPPGRRGALRGERAARVRRRHRVAPARPLRRAAGRAAARRRGRVAAGRARTRACRRASSRRLLA